MQKMFPLQNRSNGRTNSHECIYQWNIMDKIKFADLVLSLWSIWLCFDLSYIPGIEHSQMWSSIGRLYLYSKNELAVHFGNSFVSSRIRVYVYLFIFFALCLFNTHILSLNPIRKYLLQPLLLFAFLVNEMRITFATNSQFVLTIIN